MKVRFRTAIVLVVAHCFGPFLIATDASGISAHRGDSKSAPENTLPAILSAVKKGAQQIEFDVRFSADGHLVVIHDATVDRTTNGSGAVEALTLDELRQLDAGSWFGSAFAGVGIPTLREVLEVIPHHITCNVHIKEGVGIAAAVATEIAAMGRLEQCFLACLLEQAEEARAAVPGIRICNMSRQRGNRSAYVASTIASGAQYIQLHRREGTEDLPQHVDRLKQAGITINFCCEDDPDAIAALLRAGVNFVLTDNLDEALRVLENLQMVPQGGNVLTDKLGSQSGREPVQDQNRNEQNQ